MLRYFNTQLYYLPKTMTKIKDLIAIMSKTAKSIKKGTFMKVYLVGGYVRDELLGIKGSDRDFCVTGATSEEMINLGYSCVGKEFPVFLHPKTHEEYALARKERKSGHGYTGFVCDFSPDITIEEDLLRRDLTVNAIAKDVNGKLVDPVNGVKDLNARILRHIGNAFIEDPLRVLRLARFYARFYHLGFKVADETLELCKEISASKELENLTPERIWVETEKALKTDNPEIYFMFLRDCNALQQLMPEVYNLIGVPQAEQFHPEGDVFNHTMLAIKAISKLSTNPVKRFAMLTHDFGKSATPKNLLPAHPDHRKNGVPLVKNFCSRLKTPNSYSDLALRICLCHDYLNLLDTPAEELENTINQMNGYRNPDNISALIQCLTADYRGRGTVESNIFTESYNMLYIFTKAKAVDVKPIVAMGLKGLEIKQELTQRRVVAITQAQNYLKSFWEAQLK